MSDHLIAEAHRHAMALPTTHPTHADIAWYVREVAELRAEVKESRARARVAIASWDEERQRALRESGRVIELRAERASNHDCINRIASATGTLGEKSEKVVDVALSTIAALRAEVEREREWQAGVLANAKLHHIERKDAIARAERAEREVERLRAGIGECLRTNAHLADGEDCTLIGLKRCLHDPIIAPRQSALDATPRPSE